MLLKHSLLASATALAFAFGAPVGVAEAADTRALEQQMESLQNEMREVRGELDSFKAGKDESGCKFNPKKMLAIKCKNWEGQVNGRIMFDALFFDNDVAGVGLSQGSGTGMRRARINTSGKLYNTWAYKLEYDNASSTNIKDAWISYVGLQDFYGFYIKVGNSHMPFSLEELTSSRHGIFMERAMTDDNRAIPSRREGVVTGLHGGNWTVNLGVHGNPIGVANAAGTGSEQFGFAVRGTFSPFVEKGKYYTHVGMSYRWLNPSGQNTETDFDGHSPFTSAVLRTDVLRTGAIAHTDDYYVLNPELAFAWGPVAVQGEYFHIDVDRGFNSTNNTAQDDLDFDAWYAQINWWITGEMNSYNPKKGKFGRVKPKKNLSDGGWGAWSLGFRYQAANYTDGSILNGNNYQGGGMHAVTANIAWKPNPYVKWRVEYVEAWRDNDACPACAAQGMNDNPSAVQLQGLIDF